MSAQRAVLGAGLISAVAVVSEPSYTDGDYTPQCLTQNLKLPFWEHQY